MFEDDDEGEDLNMESYAVYIHKEAASVGFVFPKHDSTHTNKRKSENQLTQDITYDDMVCVDQISHLADPSRGYYHPWVVHAAMRAV